MNGEWVPTFPNARYVTSRTERDFWAGHDMDEPRQDMFNDSVIPVEEAGLLDLVDVPPEGTEIAPACACCPLPATPPATSPSS